MSFNETKLYISMTIQGASIGVGCGQTSNCVDEFNCISGVCPDFTIRRHDTKPSFKVQIEDCDGPMDLTDLVLEVNMWAKGKLKSNITESSSYFGLADGIGFQQIMVGDIIIFDRVRLPERMLVTSFDEVNKLVQVTRAYQGTTAQVWKKGSAFRIMRIMNAPAQTEMILNDILQVDGSTSSDQLTDSFLVYEWSPEDTCLPGCYWLEFKLLKMSDDISVSSLQTTSITPSFISGLTPDDYGCTLGTGVEWARRYPLDGEGFLIKITNSPTMEI